MYSVLLLELPSRLPSERYEYVLQLVSTLAGHAVHVYSLGFKTASYRGVGAME